MAKKKSANKVAAAAAAAAAAAVQASQNDDSVVLNWGDDADDNDDDIADEIIQGLEQIDETHAGELMWWELYCSSPLDKEGQIRKLSTAELRGLRDECLQLGPGEYYVVARAKKGTFIKGSKRKIKISGFARPAAAPTAAAAFDPVSFMAQMEQRAEARRLEERRERAATIKFWAPILAPIGLELAKGLFNRGGGGEPLKDLIAALVGAKELTGGGKSNDVDSLLKGIELARDLAPPEKGSTWPDALITGVTSVAKEFRPLAESLANRRAVAAPAPASAPAQITFQTKPTTEAGAPAQSGKEDTPAPGAAEDPMLKMVEPLLQKLATELEEFAVNGAVADLAAEALLAKVPRMMRALVEPQQLKEWLSQPNWWTLTVGFRPSLQPYQAYCDDVRQALLDLVEELINPSPADDSEEERDA